VLEYQKQPFNATQFNQTGYPFALVDAAIMWNPGSYFFTNSIDVFFVFSVFLTIAFSFLFGGKLQFYRRRRIAFYKHTQGLFLRRVIEIGYGVDDQTINTAESSIDTTTITDTDVEDLDEFDDDENILTWKEKVKHGFQVFISGLKKRIVRFHRRNKRSKSTYNNSLFFRTEKVVENEKPHKLVSKLLLPSTFPHGSRCRYCHFGMVHMSHNG
jgi:hypothetical protein